MVSYYGRFLAKIFVRKKPVKFGMKTWFLASFHGCQFTFQVCTGKDISADGPIRSRVVEKLIKNYRIDVVMKCTVTTFRSTLLCRKLITENLQCTGTAWNKKTENCFLASPADIKKKKHGNFELVIDGKASLCW